MTVVRGDRPSTMTTRDYLFEAADLRGRSTFFGGSLTCGSYIDGWGILGWTR